MGLDLTREQEAALIAVAISRGGNAGQSIADTLAGVPVERPAAPPPAPEISEEDFRLRVRAYAESRGWKCYHTRNSRRSDEGFQDEVMVRFQRLIFAELKTETGKESQAQREWRLAIEAVGGHVSAYLWRPSQWRDIEAILK